MTENGTTTWLPADLVKLIDEAREARMDPRRGTTVRFLILIGLAEIGILDKHQKQALMPKRRVE